MVSNKVVSRFDRVLFDQILTKLEKEKNAKLLNFNNLAFLNVGIPGLEPGKTGPESVVLPLHHIPIFNYFGSNTLASVLRVQRYGLFLKRQNFWRLFL